MKIASHLSATYIACSETICRTLVRNFWYGSYIRGYADYAALTPVDPRNSSIRALISGYGLRNIWANPGSLHTQGVRARSALAKLRTACAQALRAHADEIIFTGSGTEANNLAIMGHIEALVREGVKYADMHVIVSSIEHQSVLACVEELEKRGVAITHIGVEQGKFDFEAFDKALKGHKNTVLVSCMMVNNEVGIRLPIEDIVKKVRHYNTENGASAGDKATALRCRIHTDACQAVVHEQISLEKLGVDFLVLDSHKMYGPRGVGILFAHRGAELAPVIYGGGQENGRRSGTENLFGIHGAVTVLERINTIRAYETARITKLQSYFESKIEKSKILSAKFKIVGADIRRSPHVSSLLVPEGVDAEMLVLRLDAAHCAISTKSACLRDEDESYVLANLGFKGRHALRFSWGRYTTKGDIQRMIAELERIVKNFDL